MEELASEPDSTEESGSSAYPTVKGGNEVERTHVAASTKTEDGMKRVLTTATRVQQSVEKPAPKTETDAVSEASRKPLIGGHIEQSEWIYSQF